MDITPQDNTQPISDDQELAKALAGVLPEDDSTTDAHSPTGLKFEETPAVGTTNDFSAPAPATTPAPAADLSGFSMPAIPAVDEAVNAPIAPIVSSDLDSIKLDALKELRPLMDKVELLLRKNLIRTLCSFVVPTTNLLLVPLTQRHRVSLTKSVKPKPFSRSLKKSTTSLERTANRVIHRVAHSTPP